MDTIGLLEDKEDLFIQDVAGRLREKGYPVEYIELNYCEIPEIQNKYRIIIDRLSFQDDFLRMMMKVFSLKGSYIINNPFANLCDDKVVEYNICQKLDIPYPRTVILPKENLEMSEEIKIPLIDQSHITLKFPVVLKPHNGYGWEDVFTVNTIDEFKSVYYGHNRQKILIAQEYITPKTYYRVYFFSNLEPLFVRYLPNERKYIVSDYADIKDCYNKIKEYTTKLNIALGYDFNALEWAIDQNNQPFLIDALNEVPDILPHEIPTEYYWKIVENFCIIVEEKYKLSARNKWPFEYMP